MEELLTTMWKTYVNLWKQLNGNINLVVFTLVWKNLWRKCCLSTQITDLSITFNKLQYSGSY